MKKSMQFGFWYALVALVLIAGVVGTVWLWRPPVTLVGRICVTVCAAAVSVQMALLLKDSWQWMR